MTPDFQTQVTIEICARLDADPTTLSDLTDAELALVHDDARAGLVFFCDMLELWVGGRAAIDLVNETAALPDDVVGRRVRNAARRLQDHKRPTRAHLAALIDNARTVLQRVNAEIARRAECPSHTT